MHSSTLERSESANSTTSDRRPDILATEDTAPRCMACPVCGSGATYQTQGDRWGCTQCGSSWA